MNKKRFTVKITYFKETGKLYASAEEKREFRASPEGYCHMPDVVAWIKGLRDCGGQGSLPGLCGGWDGYIVVDCDEGYPCLILSKNQDK